MKNFLRGLAAGIAIGYLTAPRSGKETREQLSDTMNGMKDQWDEAKTQLTGYIDDIKGQVSKPGNNEFSGEAQVQNKFDQYRHDASQTRDFVQNRYNDDMDDLNVATRNDINKTDDDLKI